MKTTKKACNLVPCLYIVQYMICVWGGLSSIFFQGAPDPLATALVCILFCVIVKPHESTKAL